MTASTPRSKDRRTYDAVVVGAGPAGLSAAAEITSAGGRCLVIDQGRSHTLRDRDAPEEILSGVGGAGLFSDGKHSFFPAATELWRLPDRARLVHAYEQTRALLSRHGVEAPPLRDDDAPHQGADPEPVKRANEPTNKTDARWALKRYPSIYASLEERTRCIADLYEQCGGEEPPWLSARVVSVTRGTTGGIRDLFTIDVEQDGELREALAHRLIVATGRLSPRWIRSWLEPLGVRFEFRRLEIGVRLETLASSPLFTMLDGVDPKLSLIETDGTRLLTFCTCRDGEVVLGTSCNIHTISGRADGPRTGRSSVGLLARLTDVARAREIEAHVFAAASTRRLHASLSDVLDGRAMTKLVVTFGPSGGEVVLRTIHRFVEQFPHLVMDQSASIHGPCIEGVGDYPVSDPNLEIAPSVFIAGDACGRFRGIVASMISGRYVGARISAL